MTYSTLNASNLKVKSNSKRRTVKAKRNANGHSSEELYSFDMVSRLMKSTGRTVIMSAESNAKFDLIDDTGRLIEVKLRRVSGDKFKEYIRDGFFFEKIKHDYLKEHDALYINLVTTTYADYFFVWNVGKGSNTQFNWIKRMLDKCTDFNSSKVEKEIALLPVNANMFRYKSNEILRVTKEQILTDINNEM